MAARLRPEWPGYGASCRAVPLVIGCWPVLPSRGRMPACVARLNGLEMNRKEDGIREAMKAARIILIPGLLAAAPLLRYLLEFRIGALCLPYGYSTFYALWFLLLVPPLIGIATAFLAPTRRIWPRILLGLACALLSPFLALYAVPAGAVIYSRGFESAIQKDPGIQRLQRWAEEELKAFRSRGGSTTNTPSYWNPGDVLLDADSLPCFLKTGVFTPLGVYNFGPEFSVVTNGGRFGFSGECVAISWYLHGLLVGPPEFKSEWDPWYCKQLAPGVYSYHGMK